MIQRIQSIFLILLFAVMISTHFFDVLSFTADNSVYTFDLYSFTKFDSVIEKKLAENTYFAVMAVVIEIFALVILFMYKNRVLQIKLCKFNFVLISAFIAREFLLYGKYQTLLETLIDPTKIEVVKSFGFALFAPVIALILNFLALRYIKKDEELVRSADRIR